MPMARRTARGGRHIWNDKEFTKRRSVDAGMALADKAHAAVWRLYCEALAFWRQCRSKQCRRHRRCLGAPAQCLMRGLASVPEAEQRAAAAMVIAGGPRRVAPETHMEWRLRREPLPLVMAWRGGTPGDSG
jgi:hypothetical protein